MTLGNNLGEHLGKHLLGEYQIYLWALCDLLWLLGNPSLLAIPVTYLATSVSDRHPVLPRLHSSPFRETFGKPSHPLSQSQPVGITVGFDLLSYLSSSQSVSHSGRLGCSPTCKLDPTPANKTCFTKDAKRKETFKAPTVGCK